MSNSIVVRVVQKVRGIAERSLLDELSDRDLLGRFTQRQDVNAFEAIVRRHGAAVLRTAERLVHNHHDAEDVFQAVFLVLARKAPTISWRPCIRPWLAQVTRRLALKCRVVRPSEVAIHDQPAAVNSTGPAHDLMPILEEELGRLPVKYRMALMLCHLEGRTREEAARQLGWKVGAVKIRLERGRKLLRDRLTRRGLTLSTGAIFATLSADSASAHISNSLVEATSSAAAAFAAKAPALTASARALVLANGFLSSIATAKIKLAAIGLFLLTLFGAGAGLALVDSAETPPLEKKSETDKPSVVAADAPTEPLPEKALARLGSMRLHDDGVVFFVRFIDSGKQLVTARHQTTHRCTGCHLHPFDPEAETRPALDDKTFRVWNIGAGEEARHFGAPIPAGEANEVRTWRGQDGDLIVKEGEQFPAIIVAVSPNEKLLASSDPDGKVRIWEPRTGKEKGSILLDPALHLTSLAFTSDSQSLAAYTSARSIDFYGLDGKLQRRFTGLEDNHLVSLGDTIAFSPAGGLLAASSTLKTPPKPVGVVRILDAKTGKELRRIKDRARSSPAIAFSGDGRQFAWSSADGVIHLESARDGTEIRKIGDSRRTKYLAALAFSPDGKLLATRSFDQSIRIWDADTGKERHELVPSRRGLQGPDMMNFGLAIGCPAASVAFSPDSKLLTAGGTSSATQVWDTATGKPMHYGHTGIVQRVQLSPDGRTVLSVGEDLTVRHADPRTGQERRRFNLPASASDRTISSDGRLAALSISAETILIWDVANAKELQELKITPVPGACVGMKISGSLEFSPDGTLLYHRAGDGSIDVFDIKKAEIVKKIEGASRPVWMAIDGGLVLSPDGELLAAQKLGKILDDKPQDPVTYVFRTATGKVFRTFPRNSRHMFFSADRRVLTTANDEGIVSLLELSSGQERSTFKAVEGRIECLAMAADSSLIALAGVDHTIRLFDAWTGKEIDQRIGHRGTITNLVFSADGSKLISSSHDSTVLVWDVSSVRRPRANDGKIDPRMGKELWEALGNAEATQAFAAQVKLRDHPQDALAVLGTHLLPAASLDGKEVARLVAQLDDDAFAVRQAAERSLEDLGSAAESSIRKALANRPGADARERLEQLLQKLSPDNIPSATVMRALRGLETLERIGDAQALAIIEKLTHGAADALITHEAKSALRRLREAK